MPCLHLPVDACCIANHLVLGPLRLCTLVLCQARQASVDLVFVDVSPDLDDVVVNIDKHKMSQVLRNIVSNGLKFTPKGGAIPTSPLPPPCSFA